MSKLKGWHAEDINDSAPQYKDIKPGDQVNHKAALNKAYEEAGKSMAKDAYDHQVTRENANIFKESETQVFPDAETGGGFHSVAIPRLTTRKPSIFKFILHTIVIAVVVLSVILYFVN